MHDANPLIGVPLSPFFSPFLSLRRDRAIARYIVVLIASDCDAGADFVVKGKPREGEALTRVRPLGGRENARRLTRLSLGTSQFTRQARFVGAASRFSYRT